MTHVTPRDELEYRLLGMRADSVMLEEFGNWLVKKLGPARAALWAELLLQKVDKK